MGRPSLGKRRAQTVRFLEPDHEVIVRLAGEAGLSVNEFVAQTVVRSVEEGRYPRGAKGQLPLPLSA